MILAESIIALFKSYQWHQPTPIQKYCIPTSLLDRDLMACAQTGSGKTGAFAVPTIHKMLEKGPGGKCLVVVPTRELAIQC